MAKKEKEVLVEETPAVVAEPVTETKALENAGPRGLAMPGASPALLARIDEVRENLETVENFRLPRIKMTSHGAEIIEGEEPLALIEGVMLHAKKTNVYYDKPYNPSAVEPPTCYSLDGETPAKDMKDKEGKARPPVNPTCRGCPMAEFGTNSMKSGKACRNMKPLFLLLGDEAMIPRQLTVSPTGLKAANQYLMNLTERGLNFRKVKTQIEFYKENPRDTYCKLRFKMIGKLDQEASADVEYLRKFWLPVMSNQTIEQSEMVSETAPQASAPVDTKGEY